MNFLPIEKRIEIKKEYLGRFFVVAGICFLFVFLIGIIFLSPLSFLFRNEQENLNKQLSLFEKKIAAGETEDILPNINDLNTKTSSILSTRDSQLSSIIEEIINKKTPAITISSFTFSEDRVSITGRSQTRIDLIAFVDSLKKETLFKKIDSPVSSLIKEKDLDFIINIGL